MLSNQPTNGMGTFKKSGPGQAGAPPTPMTPASSGVNLAAFLNTPQAFSSQQLQRALGVGMGVGLPPTPPSTVGRSNISLPSPGQGQFNASPQTKPPNDPLFNPKNTTNVYVNNLPLHTPDDALFRLCSPYGKVLSVRVFHREDAPVPGSYGFVLFETLEDARRCIVALHRSRYQASFAKTTKVPNPLLADQLLLPFVAARPNHGVEEASSLYVRGLARSTDQHALELLFVPHFVVSFRLGEELGDGNIVWPNAERDLSNYTGKENMQPDQGKDVRWKVALVRLKDHDTAEEMIDKLDGAYARGSETLLSVRFAEAGAWRRVGSNRPKNNFGPYSEEERLNDAGWVGVGVPNANRAHPNPAFFNMGLGAMGIQPQQQPQQQMNRPAVGSDQWIDLSNMNLNMGMMGGLAGLRGLQGLQGMNGINDLQLANLQNSANLANLVQSLNYGSQLGLSSQLPITARAGLSNMDANSISSFPRQDIYPPALFTPAQLQSPVSIRNPNTSKGPSPNHMSQFNGQSDFRGSAHTIGGGNAHTNASNIGTPTNNAVRAPPPSPCSPQNTRTTTGAVYTPQSFLPVSSLASIPESQEEMQQNQKLNEALAAQLLGTKAAVPVVVEPKQDSQGHQNQRLNEGIATHLYTPQSSLPPSQNGTPSAKTNLPLPADSKTANAETVAVQILSQGMPAQRPRTPARGVGVTINLPSAPAAAHLPDKATVIELSAMMNPPKDCGIVKTTNGAAAMALTIPVAAAIKDDNSAIIVTDA